MRSPVPNSGRTRWQVASDAVSGTRPRQPEEEVFCHRSHWEAGSPIRADADDFMKYIVTPVVSIKELGYEAPIRR
jgi:hypothetical protein